MALTTYTELKASVADWLNRTDLTSAIPDFITLAESKFKTELKFYASFSPLSGSVATNDVYTQAPDLYLYGSLLAAAPYLEHDERVPVWKALYREALDRLNTRRDWETAAAQGEVDTYAHLKTTLGLWLNRSDASAQVGTFITLAESEMKRRLRRTSRRDTITITARVISLPCAASELRSIYIRSSSVALDRPLDIGTPEMVAEMHARNGGTAGRPVIAAITSAGRELIVAPAPDADYDAEVIYFTLLQALSTTNTVNDELREAPDAYLYGSLLQAAPYFDGDARIPLWQAKFDAAIDQLNEVRQREEYGASLRPVRLPVVFG